MLVVAWWNGRVEEASVLVKVHALLSEVLCAELLGDTADEEEPDFVRDMEESERDLTEGQTIPHDEVMLRHGIADDAAR